MPVTVTMPQLGESVTEGTITRWLKAVGDTVVADEPLVEVSTDKVDTEIPAPASGVLLSIDADEDAVVEVGGTLGVIGDSADAAPAAAAPAPTAPAAQATPEPAAETPPTPAPVTEPTPAPTAASAASGEEVVVVLPALGESVTEGVVTRWLKSVGDTVAADEPLVEVSTDKVDTEIPAPAAGTLTSIAVEADGTVEVGAEIARISTGANAPAAAPSAPAPPVAPAAPAPVAATPAPPAPAAPAPSAPTAPGSSSTGSDANAGSYVTPLVRRLAAENNIDLSTVTGTGVGGRIRKADVLTAVEARKAAAPSAPAATVSAATSPSAAASTSAPESSAMRGQTEKLSRLRRVIAERMVESLQTSAQLTTVVEVDVTRIAALRQRVKGDFEAREGVKLTFLPVLLQGGGRGPQGLPAGQFLHRHGSRDSHVPRIREPRYRGRHRSRAVGSGHPRCR
jgi:pyruvate dehydrogenase E2 component (dihydrolipoamide acetyltransferase)